ncbi:hypothetical protein [Craterilacuibacter sp. RT1T]|uniref:hypothetical protein n=1 Tax=Craterilacuibacter sp. RT1T TaxID=2942211 RepID=UPI0020BFD255|nr:hypothetical protein [Craterilacuibacter sp. RT1T]MCL6264241.1 hypothetical protein [Craterilacuibacter sp. RT1T]
MRKLILAVSLALSAMAAQAATVYTGDKVQGVAVISPLDVADLAPADGKVLSTGTDAMREPRGTRVHLLIQNPDPKNLFTICCASTIRR